MRDIPVGNGSVLAAFDRNGILREFYFPHVGEENHTKGEPFRIGLWIDGQFSWIPDGWTLELNYLDDTMVTNVVMTGYGLKIVMNDIVDFDENIYLKKISIENLTGEARDVRFFIAQDFHIYGNELGDTAAFRPDINALLHYKGDRYFLINILANHKYGIDFYATGNKEIHGQDGTWRDAEDGVLGKNPIAQGSVDSVICIPFSIKPNEKESAYYWIAAGKTWEEVKNLNEIVKKKTPEMLLKRTADYWHYWVDKETLDFSLLPEKVGWLYKRSLLIARTQINICGSIIAANDSDTIAFNRDTYCYMWPRDGALVAHALDLAGYSFTRHFYNFCAKILEKEGYFLHKYLPSGSLASSWHPWVKENKSQLPIQEDETALVIWALWNHYKTFRDIEFLRPLYHSLIIKGANFMMNYRNPKTRLPLPSYDLWEERQGVLTFTVSAVYAGLLAAANFAETFGETSLAEEYRQGAAQMREGMDRYLYLENEKRFARMINFKKDGTLEVDATVDASLWGAFAFGAYSPDDEKVKNTMEQIQNKLGLEGGGIIRYENDNFYRQGDGPSNGWFVATLWVAQYYIAIAKNKEDLEKAKEILQWVANRALPSGVLAEQFNPRTGEPLSVSPLTWSHGTYIATVQQYLNKLLDIEKCPQCGKPKYSKKIYKSPT